MLVRCYGTNSRSSPKTSQKTNEQTCFTIQQCVFTGCREYRKILLFARFSPLNKGDHSAGIWRAEITFCSYISKSPVGRLLPPPPSIANYDKQLSLWWLFVIISYSGFGTQQLRSEEHLRRADNRNLKPRMEAPEAHVFPTRNKGF